LFNASRARILRSFPDDTADEHYYMESDWFLRNTHRYDHYPRGTKIFLGEYAAHEPAARGRRPNNLYSALCEAAYLTGIERNSDVVTLCCYAPLLARLGMDQWTPDLIWFSGTQVVRTPNYYVQQMFSRSLGDQLIESAMTNDAGEKVTDITARLYHTASVSQDGRVYVKLVNVSGQEKTITLQLLGGDFSSRTQGSMTLLTGAKQDTNSLTTEKVFPVESAVSFADGAVQIILPGYAAMVITVP
jgi:alpha-L-arabinofuranosidase